MNDSLCTVFVCDGGRAVHIGRGGSETKEEEKDDKGSVAFIGSRIKNIHTLPCVLPGPLYDVIAVPFPVPALNLAQGRNNLDFKLPLPQI